MGGSCETTTRCWCPSACPLWQWPLCTRFRLSGRSPRMLLMGTSMRASLLNSLDHFYLMVKISNLNLISWSRIYTSLKYLSFVLPRVIRNLPTYSIFSVLSFYSFGRSMLNVLNECKTLRLYCHRYIVAKKEFYQCWICSSNNFNLNSLLE